MFEVSTEKPHRTIATRLMALGPCLILLATIGPARAANQNLDELRQQASAWLKTQAEGAYADSRAEVTMGLVDHRLRFPLCQRFSFALAAGAHPWGRGSLEAQCTEPQPWRLYLSYAIRLNGPALILNQPLLARESLTTAKTTLRRIDYTLSPESYLRELPGEAQTTRPLAAGQPLSLDLLTLPKIVQAGREVQIVVAGQGFNLSQRGTAMASASMGQPVKVKTANGRILRGQVKGPSMVEIHP